MPMNLLDDTLFIPEVKYLFRILLKKGDELRLVGGCLRDFIGGVGKIHDHDFATSYRPKELIEILDEHNIKYTAANARFGTIATVINGRKFEITSLRKDIKTDGRHANVEFTDDYAEDAKRRDFTFNALYCDSRGKIYDYFSGILDLSKRLVKFIGDPEQRILEDHLRILRFFRFYSSHSFFLDYKSLMACRKHGDKIRKLSRERVKNELSRILESNYPPKTLKIMEYHGILQNTLDYGGELDLSNVEIFFSIKNRIDFKYNYLFILVLMLSRNEIDLNLALERREKVYVNSVLTNIPKVISHSEIKKLLFLLGDAKKVKDIVMICICNNYSPHILGYLDFTVKTEIPRLKITRKTLEHHGFTDIREYGTLMTRAKGIFLESAFKVYGDALVEKLKDELVTSPTHYFGKDSEKTTVF
jgi:poly(A) polymerase